MKEYGGVAALGLLLAVGMIAMPAQCMAAASRGLVLGATVIIPSLFPFFICAKLLIKSGFAAWMGRRMQGLMRPLFGVPGCGAFAFVMGIVSGYPMGAKCGADLYATGQCTKGEAQRLIGFCNNSGPMFVLGAVGSGLLGNPKLGILLYAAHVLSALSVGLVLARIPSKHKEVHHAKPIPSAPCAKSNGGMLLSEAVTESVLLVLYVCGFVLLFGVILQLVSLVLPPNMPPMLTALCYGVLEITNGVNGACLLPPGQGQLMLLSAIIGWGGIGVMLQVFGITGAYGFSKKAFVFAKALQSVFACGYTWLLLRLPLGLQSVSATSRPLLPGRNLWLESLILLAITQVLCLLLSIGAAKLSNPKSVT